ncbi:adenosylmethionine--8-amino-7-oxononanoate transaminase [Candidatus Deianiraea vastatrix]|uniref:adenosylmethionine--8-amino-7-oxononanoate transaminase n=1 Tax=Candidatus Deianiraea vastatrix TaxID=2163644 RepID=A0A5B8XD10_9RICK|nr:adenosylmethionine--8-amino-7-oxononanoate transaminase [Candidatus Deianiraea vastatrix]QED23130.1 Adenosylmethionine-8-amino-7-oxononanoate aminotransferase [Candidatus Deianiraea vastatrix]
MSKIWYPFSQEAIKSDKIKIVKAKNEMFFDDKGNSYIDLISSWWTSIHGHCNDEICDIIASQSRNLDHVIFSDFTHEMAEKLVMQIDKMTKSIFAKMFFSDNGSTSVEVAVKIAHQYWKNCGINSKNIVISFKNGYHGDTLLAMSAGKMSGYFDNFVDLMPSFEFLDYPSTYIGDENFAQKEENVLNNLMEIIEKNPDKISSLIIEPLVQGAGGMNMCRADFLEKIVKICNENKIIVIFDEVMTGFYRTGEYFAHTNLLKTPDIICLSKGITGGFFPLGMTCVKSWIYDAFYSSEVDKSFLHGHSYTANPIICAAAAKSCEILQRGEIAEKILKISRIYDKILADFPSDICEKPRICGTIFAFDIKCEGGYGSQISRQIKESAIKSGLNIRPLGKTIYFMPPYCIDLSNLQSYIMKILSLIQNII